MANQIIEVPDIAVVKTISGAKQLLSLRDQKIVKEKALVDICAGSGIKYEGDLYVLKSEKIVPEGEVIVMATTTKADVIFGISGKSRVIVDWGDGVVETNTVFRHTYTDGAQSHDIKFYGSADAFLALHCGDNQLTSIDVSMSTALRDLNCYKNQLTTLDVSKNIDLSGLRCYYNQLTTLDVSKNTALTELWCGPNPLVSDQSSLTSIANSLPDRTGETAGKLRIYDSTSAAWIKDICTAKNWTIS